MCVASRYERIINIDIVEDNVIETDITVLSCFPTEKNSEEETRRKSERERERGSLTSLRSPLPVTW